MCFLAHNEPATIIIIITVIYHLSWKYTIQKKHTVMRDQLTWL